MYKYPVYMTYLHGNEKKYVIECIDSTWISSKGKFVNLFESAFASFCGVKYAVCVTNGTVALHLALLALDIGFGDEVIVPTLTYIAAVNAITYTGATPVFADSLESTWQIDPQSIKKNITPKTKAIIVVHLYGHPCAMDEIAAIANEHKLFVIEDCAEAIGSKFNNKSVGSFSNIATFSFFGNKTITTGEGGMVITSNSKLFNRITHFKGQGLAKYREYWHDVVGYNYRMTNICAAIGLAQLEQIDEILFKKVQIAKQYRLNLSDLPISFQEEALKCHHSYWMYSIRLNKNRDRLREYLSANSIETRPAFYPAHQMPMYNTKGKHFINAERISQEVINLPSYPGLSEEDIKHISDVIRKFYAKT